jgi:predicted SnoaL-like aldol condensation-catalyzing enzyme
MKLPLVFCLAAATLLAAPVAMAAAAASETYIIIPSGRKNTAKEEANKKLVLEWWREFWDRGRIDEWSRWMAPDFINHDPRQPPVGAQALVDWLKAQNVARGGGRGSASEGRAAATPQPRKIQAQLFALADGDLVFIAHAPTGFDPQNPSAFTGDPARTFGGNMVRVRNGKIVEWWSTGGVSEAPPAGAAARTGGAAPPPRGP